MAKRKKTTQRQRYEEYQKSLTQIQKMAEEAVSDIDRAALTDAQYKQVLCRLKKTYGDMAKTAAHEYYLVERAIQTGVWWDKWDVGLTDNVADSFVLSGVDECIKNGEDIGKFIGKCAQIAAERQIKLCARKDPARPRYALVAQPGACEWCRMISSQGWVYQSEETADSPRHSGCSCAVVASFDRDNPSLAGYDPDALRDEYRAAVKATEHESAKLWESMSDAEKAKYKKGYSDYSRKRIMAQMRAKKAAVSTGPLSVTEALDIVNKSYYSGSFAWGHNCQRCVVAYEANRRGIKCKALPRLKNDTIFNYGSAWFESFVSKAGAHLKSTDKWLTAGITRATQWEKKFSEFIKTYGWENSRGIIHVEWKSGGAHVFNFEVENGVVHYYDAQVGKEYLLEDWINEVKPTKITFERVDDMDLDEDRLKLCIERI